MVRGKGTNMCSIKCPVGPTHSAVALASVPVTLMPLVTRYLRSANVGGATKKWNGIGGKDVHIRSVVYRLLGGALALSNTTCGAASAVQSTSQEVSERWGTRRDYGGSGRGCVGPLSDVPLINY